jgi:hypothetical protein
VEQANLFAWLNCVRYRGQAIGLSAYAVPNGSHLAGDERVRAIQMAKLKKQGFKIGVPDVIIDIPVEPYHGLRIEMKRVHRSETSDAQLEWQKRMLANGYQAVIAKGFLEARMAVVKYFDLFVKDSSIL